MQDPRLLIPNYTQICSTNATITYKRTFLEVIIIFYQYDASAGRLPFPSRLYFIASKDSRRDAIKSIFKKLNTVVSFDMIQVGENQVGTVKFQDRTITRKAMQRIVAGKYEQIIEAGFDLDGII